MFLFKNWYYLWANPTRAELALEPAIAALGKRYRAQHLFPTLRHIADFTLLDDKVVIEVDGTSHELPEQRRKDAVHTLGLHRLGWRVVRCTNEEAITKPHLTVASLQEQLNHLPSLAELEARLAAFGPAPTKPTQRRAPAPATARVPVGPKARTAPRKPAKAQ